MSWRRLLKKYSRRAWAYRPGTGWVFDDLTPDELTVFRADPPPRIETVRVPIDTATVTIDHYTKGMQCWFMFCTLTKLHPLAFTFFRFYQVESVWTNEWGRIQYPPGPDDGWTDEMIEYPLEPSIYAGWLWNDEIEICEALGCDITVHSGHGWDVLTPPTKGAPRPRYQERVFIYGLVDPLTQEVFYVGQSSDPQQRFLDHLRDTSNSAKVERIKNLREQGHVPTLINLEEVDGVVALEREKWWVRYYEKPSQPLTNYLSQIRPWQERNKRRRLALQKVDERKERPRLTWHLKQAHIYAQAATLTLEDWAEILAYFDWKCAYCKNHLMEILVYLVPLQQGGGVTATNCIPACRACKTTKKILSTEDTQAFQTYFALSFY